MVASLGISVFNVVARMRACAHGLSGCIVFLSVRMLLQFYCCGHDCFFVQTYSDLSAGGTWETAGVVGHIPV